MQGDNFANEQGRIMELAMWLRALLLVGLRTNSSLAPNYVVLAPDIKGGGHIIHEAFGLV